MRVYIITAVHNENNEVTRIKGYLSSVEFSLFFPPLQFPIEFSRNEMIALIRQGNIFDIRTPSGENIPLRLNRIKNTVNLEICQFIGLERY